jgi:transposase
MARPSSYPRELRERAVRLVSESKSDYPSEFETIRSIAGKLGIGSPETLRKWVRRAEIDGGQRPGKTSEEIAEIRELKKENAELRRANEILKSASAFFAAELDRPSRF